LLLTEILELDLELAQQVRAENLLMKLQLRMDLLEQNCNGLSHCEDHQDNLALLVQLDHKDRQDNLALLVLQVHKVQLAQLVHKVQLVQLE